MTTTYAGQWGPEPFLDRSGNAVPRAVVSVLDSTGATLVELYGDRDRATPCANPLPFGVDEGAPGVDEQSNGLFWTEPGHYVLKVEVNGNVVYQGPIVVDVDPIEQTDSDAATIAAEITARVAGDTALDVRVDVLEADPTTGAALDAEIADRIAGDDALQAALDAETLARADADSDELTARTGADSALDARVDVLEADPTTGTALSAEVTRAAAAESALASAVAAVEGSDVDSVNGRSGVVTGLAEQADLAAEATTRAAADTAESSDRATAITNEATARTTGLATETTNRTTADGLKVDKATLTTDGDLLTRTAGVPARLTRAQLAADAAFTGTFASIGVRELDYAENRTGVNFTSAVLATNEDLPFLAVSVPVSAAPVWLRLAVLCSVSTVAASLISASIAEVSNGVDTPVFRFRSVHTPYANGFVLVEFATRLGPTLRTRNFKAQVAHTSGGTLTVYSPTDSQWDMYLMAEGR